VNHGIRVDLLDGCQHHRKIADVDIAADETGHLVLQPRAHPGRITVRAEEVPTQIVVEATTRWPCPAKCNTASLPMSPLLPVTKTFMLRAPSAIIDGDLAARHLQGRRFVLPTWFFESG